MAKTSDTADSDKEPHVRKPLSLKRTVESGQVRQSFAHGRSKSVVVEKRRKRTIKQGASGDAIIIDETPIGTPTPTSLSGDHGVSTEHLSPRERAKRLVALEESKKRAVREAEEAEVAEAARLVAATKAAKNAKKSAADSGDTTEASLEAAAAMPLPDSDAPRRDANKARPASDDDKPRQDNKRPTRRTGERQRRAGKLTINDALNDEERVRSLASIKRRREREKRQAGAALPQEKLSRTITLPDTITIQELANRMAERSADVIKILMQQGIMAKITETIDADTAQIVAEDLGHMVKRVSEGDIEDGLIASNDDGGEKITRPPVITIMGHVDHGKTSLLDALRRAKVAAGEAGGITQHIGAYQSFTDKGAAVSFIDTPGHAAFTAMRARGASVTDIVVLVVAGDDSVQPQTIEAIAHAKAANAPLIVAINKMDKPDADAARVKNDLLQHEVIDESLGGDVQMIEVSAQSGAGLDDLLEAIILQSELMDLRANPTCAAVGVVIEARLDKGRGAVATILVQRGTLRAGDIFVVGQESGRVRALVDATGKQIKEATPSMPIEVLGISGVPRAGEVLTVVENEARAREVADYRERKAREKSSNLTVERPRSLDQFLEQSAAQEKKDLTLVVKGDVQGSVEALTQMAAKLGNDEVQARVVYSGVGGISESDVTLASTADALIVGFNVRARAEARQAAEVAGVEIRYYNIIYDLIDDLKAALTGMLSPELREKTLGKGAVLDIFSIKGGHAAGCRIDDGAVKRGARVRIIRDEIVLHEGALSSLRRFKDEVKEVVSGQECGMAFENFSDVKAGDVIECFEVESIRRELEA